MSAALGEYMQKKLKLKNVFLLAAFLGVMQTVNADTITVQTDKHLRLEGEFGEVTHSLYDVLEYLDLDPSFPDTAVPISMSVGMEYQKWAANPEEIDGWAYSFDLELTRASSFKVEEGTVVIEGQAALYLQRGMWLMAMDYPENFEVQRTSNHGEFTIRDVRSNALECWKGSEDVPGSHLVRSVARCLVRP